MPEGVRKRNKGWSLEGLLCSSERCGSLCTVVALDKVFVPAYHKPQSLYQNKDNLQVRASAIQESMQQQFKESMTAPDWDLRELLW